MTINFYNLKRIIAFLDYVYVYYRAQTLTTYPPNVPLHATVVGV